MAKDFDHVIVETVQGSEYLYEFASEIICNRRNGKHDMYKGTPLEKPLKPKRNWVIADPIKIWRQYGQEEFKALQLLKHGILLEKEWRKYGTEKPNRDIDLIDIMFAFRGPKVFGGRIIPEKQYEQRKAEKLAQMVQEEGLSAACYGGKDNLHMKDTVDLRGMPLDELCGVLAESGCAVGPSSGTIHLASLCGTPHVSWFGAPKNLHYRYEKHWNPFDSPILFMPETDPTPNQVFRAVMRQLERDD
jgi:ADP-heptose:LPS heptosyltransferase